MTRSDIIEELAARGLTHSASGAIVVGTSTLCNLVNIDCIVSVGNRVGASVDEIGAALLAQANGEEAAWLALVNT